MRKLIIVLIILFAFVPKNVHASNDNVGVSIYTKHDNAKIEESPMLEIAQYDTAPNRIISQFSTFSTFVTRYSITINGSTNPSGDVPLIIVFPIEYNKTIRVHSYVDEAITKYTVVEKDGKIAIETTSLGNFIISTNESEEMTSAMMIGIYSFVALGFFLVIFIVRKRQSK